MNRNEDMHKSFQSAIEEHKSELIVLLQNLIRRPSDTSEKECQLFIEDWLKKRGMDCDVWNLDVDSLNNHNAWVETDLDYTDRPNLVSVYKGKGGGKSLSLLSHIDVVPIEEPEAWIEKDPWSGAIVEDKIYGRGSLDMKAGVAIGLYLLGLLKKLGIELKGDVIFQSVIDEENGGNGTLAAIERGYNADASIFLEPSGEEYMGISGRGAQFFRITVHGIGGGIEYQYEMPNAIGKAFILYQAVERFADMLNSEVSHPLYAYGDTKVPCAICKINAGNWASTTPVKCVMEGSVECLPGEDIEDRKKQFKDYLLKVASRDPWLSENPPTIEFFGLRYESAEIPIDSPIINAVREASKQVLGKDVVPMGGGGSDLRLPVLYGNSPCILYGPKGGAIHSTNEFVEIDSMMNVAMVVGQVLLDWCR